METAGTTHDQPDYAGFFRRQWQVVALGALAGLILGLGALQVLPPQYTATASVLVQSVGNQTDINVVNGRTTGDVNLDTEAQLVRSTPVATRAQGLLGVDTGPTALAKKVSVTVPPNTNVLRIHFTGRSPTSAAAGAHAFAQAYLANRAASAKADLDQQSREIEKHIRVLESNLRTVSNRIQDEAPGSSSRSFDLALQAGLSNQINTLNQRLNGLETTTVIPGQIIADAEPPRSKSGPNPSVWLSSGLVIGVLGGLFVGLVRYRYDRRLRSLRDIEQAEVSVLVRLPVGLPADIRRSADADAARGVRQLCNVMASTMSGDQRIIAVTGVDTDASAVVTNLAIGLSSSGWEVAVVCAGRQARQTARLLQVPEDRGLSEALRSTADVLSLLQPSPVNSRVVVLAPGVDPDVVVDETGPAAVGLALGALRSEVDAIIVQTPPTDESGGATAQMIASVAHSALFVVELDRSRQDDLADAVMQFGRVGATILGVVAMAPHSNGRRSDPPWPFRERSLRRNAEAQPASGATTVTVLPSALSPADDPTVRAPVAVSPTDDDSESAGPPSDSRRDGPSRHYHDTGWA